MKVIISPNQTLTKRDYFRVVRHAKNCVSRKYRSMQRKQNIEGLYALIKPRAFIEENINILNNSEMSAMTEYKMHVFRHEW